MKKKKKKKKKMLTNTSTEPFKEIIALIFIVPWQIRYLDQKLKHEKCMKEALKMLPFQL